MKVFLWICLGVALAVALYSAWWMWTLVKALPH